jgi:hypothetical protein
LLPKTRNFIKLEFWQFTICPSLYSKIQHNERKPVPAKKTIANYYYISQHYKWALEQIFIQNGFKLAIITEGTYQ